jgi:hypothetical protein
VSERMWGFKSPLAHTPRGPHETRISPLINSLVKPSNEDFWDAEITSETDDKQAV